jgi:thymidylate synthase (FAD)
MRKKIKAYGINIILPKVYLLNYTPLFISEFAARTCYNSFDKSEHKEIKELDMLISNEENLNDDVLNDLSALNEKGSDLLYQLSHVYFHESTLEHISFNFLIKNTSRGVLQELARHRIASYSVKSTRYTMSDIINNYHIVKKFDLGYNEFFIRMSKLNFLITKDENYNNIEYKAIFDKLSIQESTLGTENFYDLTIAKSIIDDFKNSKNPTEALDILNSKAKRNVGDSIKHIVTDNFVVDLAFTLNLRSLKNFINLRLSGSAYFQIQLLSNEIYKLIPKEYKILLTKNEIPLSSKIDEKIKKGEW